MNFNLSGEIFSMDFKLPDNRNLNIKLPIASVQTMTLLLRKLCVKAQWEIASIEPENVSTPSSPAPSIAGSLH
jgi:hypothetical protein